MKKMITKIALAAAMVVPAVAGAAVYNGSTPFDNQAISILGAGTYNAAVTYTWSDLIYQISAAGKNSVTQYANDTTGALDYWVTAGSSATKLFANTIADSNTANSGAGTISLTGLQMGTAYNLHLEGTWAGVGTVFSFTAPTAVLANSVTYSNQVAAVPEPETYAMMLAGLMMMGTIARRRNKSK